MIKLFILGENVISQLYIGRKSFRVNAILEHWREAGRWWEGETEKDFYLLAISKGQYIIYRDDMSKGWFLYKILD